MCKKPESLKKRYSTYYGSSYKCYYIEIDNSSFEKKIHKILKKQGLHIENELFVYNEKYDFNFYIQELNKISKQEEKILFPCKNECCIDELYINDQFCKSCEFITDSEYDTDDIDEIISSLNLTF